MTEKKKRGFLVGLIIGLMMVVSLAIGFGGHLWVGNLGVIGFLLIIFFPLFRFMVFPVVLKLYHWTRAKKQ